jgi:hypothetical protein
MTKEELVEYLVDIDLDYWTKANPIDADHLTKRDLKVAITKYQYVAERLKELLDIEYQKGYDTCLKNMTWTDRDPSLWK